MYIVDLGKRLFHKNNIPVLLYLVLNVFVSAIFIGLLEDMFDPQIESYSTYLVHGLIAYMISLLIALSPIGEVIMRIQTGCELIDDENTLNYIQSIFEEVYKEAREKNPEIPENVQLYMNNEMEANAFATGRKTLCITKEMLAMPKNYIKAALSHEFGHLAHKDTDLVMLVLGVSRSGYLAWLHHVPSDTEKRRKAVKAKIQDIYDDSKQNYGAPKITVELRKTGEVISERTVGTYMRQMGIRAQWSKPWTITTKDSDFSTELQNILDEQFNPDRPNAVWCSDITYIWTIDGFVYLTSVMDLFSRKIIAWTLSETLEVSCVIDTINKAKARRNIDQPLIIHSDRGSQYVAKEYKKATENMQRSYSKKAFPWDNACIESFHSIIKREWLNRFKIRDYKQAYQLIFEYLEAFYNTKRIHSHCNYMSPNEFERVYERTHTEAELLAG